MGNFMKNVWTDSQGTIHRPEPGSSRVWLSNPTRRFSLVSATSTDSPRTVWRVRFRTRTFNFVGYHRVRKGCGDRGMRFNADTPREALGRDRFCQALAKLGGGV